MDVTTFMDVMTSFKCKICSFTCAKTEDMAGHVKGVHLAVLGSVSSPMTRGDAADSSGTSQGQITDGGLVAVGTEEAGVNTETGASNVVYVDVTHVRGDEHHTPVDSRNGEAGLGGQLTAAPSTISQSTAVEPVTTVYHTPEIIQATVTSGRQQGSRSDSLETPSKELYLCGQCKQDFNSMASCRQHLEEEHNFGSPAHELKEERAELAFAISATEVMPGRTSIATQMYKKKPGRKRKTGLLAGSGMVMEGGDTKEGSYSTSSVAADDGDADYELSDTDGHDSDKDYMLSPIERTSSGRKRRPNSLLKDYLVPKSRYRGMTGVGHPIDPAAEEERAELVRIRHQQELESAATAALNESRKAEYMKMYVLKCRVKGCKARFKSDASMELHKKCHTRGDSFKCREENCGYVCETWGPMKSHLWRTHDIDTDLLKCEVCGRRAFTYSQLMIHQQIHTDTKNFVCDICQRAFKLYSHLKTHQITHSPLENRRLPGPKSINDKVKHFVCQFCGHATARKAMMQLHLRTHTGEKPHKCDQCNYCTGDHNSLRRHKMRHTGQKPYACTICDYACIQAISLKLHLKSKHPDCTTGVYGCSKCTYRTVNSNMYDNHVKDHENGLITDKESDVIGRPPPVGALEPPMGQFGNIEISSEDLEKLESCQDVLNGSVSATDLVCTALNAITSNLTNAGSAPPPSSNSIETTVTKSTAEDGRLVHKIAFSLPQSDGTRRAAEVILQTQFPPPPVVAVSHPLIPSSPVSHPHGSSRHEFGAAAACVVDTDGAAGGVVVLDAAARTIETGVVGAQGVVIEMDDQQTVITTSGVARTGGEGGSGHLMGFTTTGEDSAQQLLEC